MTDHQSFRSVRRLRVVLLAAALHSLAWGAFIILLPTVSADVYGFARPLQDEHLWRGTGLMILLLGTGYLLAALDPDQHWGLVLIGLLAKVLGPIGLVVTVWQGQVSPNVLWLLPVNDVIWWWPFVAVVKRGIVARRNFSR